MNEQVSYVVLQQRGNRILEFEKTDYLSFVKSEMQLEVLSKSKMTYLGEISPHGVSRLKKAILCWSHAISLWNEKTIKEKSFNQKQINFLTLTLCAPQRHSDKVIKEKILAPFVRILKRDHSVSNYIWKAESQENLNIHFHLLIDVFIDKDVVRNIWNDCLDALGYVDRFEEKFKHRNPPSTMIEAVRNFDEIEYYMSKYISKSDNYRLIEGAVWKCSKALSSVNFFEVERSNFEEKKLQVATLNKEIEFKSFDHCNVYFVPHKQFRNFLSTSAISLHRIYCQCLLNFLLVGVDSESFKDYYLETRIAHRPARSVMLFEEDMQEKLRDLKQKKKLCEEVCQLSFGFD